MFTLHTLTYFMLFISTALLILIYILQQEIKELQQRYKDLIDDNHQLEKHTHKLFTICNEKITKLKE